MSNVAPSRTAAFRILLAIEQGSEHSDELLRAPEIDRLSTQDRHLLTSMVMGVLRWQLALDASISVYLARPKARIDPPIRIALRLGAFQLLHLDRVPAYAAIGESVELTKISGNRHSSGMVNAVLRKIAAEKKKVSDTVTNTGDLARSMSHPQWLVDRWVRNFGFSQAKAICEYDQQPAPVFIRLLHTEAEKSLLDEGIALAPGNFLANVRKVMQGDIQSTKAFQRGAVRIQDEGSQLIAELAGHGQTILDACAAPGGKTAVLAERNPRSAITAWDISKRRLDDMRRRLGPVLGASIQFVTVDAANRNSTREYDLILSDVPCSGTGTLARNPEIRYRLSEADLSRHHARQVNILSSVMRSLAPQGHLLYSTCSLEPEENEAVIRECLSADDEFTLTPINLDRLEEKSILHTEGAQNLRDTALVNGCLRLLPGIHGCDGFFAALLTRRQ